MSKRAEEAALEAYPNDSFVSVEYADMCRSFYQEGYEQAEKDLALTLEDIRLIIQAYYDTNRIEREAHGEGGLYEFSKTPDYLHQILMRYNYLKYEL